MSFTITITGDSGVVSYAVNSGGDGKYARYFDSADFVADIKKTRVPGTDGSFVQRLGFVGHKIKIGVRYIATKTDTPTAQSGVEVLESNIAADINQFSKEAVSIEYEGQTFSGCNLVPGSARKKGPILPTGRADDQVFVDIEMMFSEDLPSFPAE